MALSAQLQEVLLAPQVLLVLQVVLLAPQALLVLQVLLLVFAVVIVIYSIVSIILRSCCRRCLRI